MAYEFRCAPCACCCPAIFAKWFGAEHPKRRRSHEEVVIAKRKKAEGIARRKEFYAQRRLEKEAKNGQKKMASVKK